jgi:hypothetical protein
VKSYWQNKGFFRKDYALKSDIKLEHFSVGLHKAQARRQYEQYGKREATPGKLTEKCSKSANKLIRRYFYAAYATSLTL